MAYRDIEKRRRNDLERFHRCNAARRRSLHRPGEPAWARWGFSLLRRRPAARRHTYRRAGVRIPTHAERTPR